MALRLLVSALAVAGAVSAQSSSATRTTAGSASTRTSSADSTTTTDSSDSGSGSGSSGGQLCSTSGTLTIQNQGDATSLAYCATYSGHIAVATGTTGAINIPTLRLITGNFVMQNAPNVSALGADSLIRIGGDFRLSDNTLLGKLSFPYLTQVRNLYFNALPNLGSLDFNTGLKTAASVDIENTGLSKLDGISLMSVGSVIIANNRFLQDITFGVNSTSGIVSIEGNGDRLAVNLVNLTQAQNLTILNSAKIQIPSLQKVTGNLGFKNNTLSTIEAPMLTTIGGTLAIAGNNNANNISFPALTTISGGLQVQANSQLEDVGSSFPALTTISGATDSFGAFTSFKLPSLKDNRGAFNLQSTGDISADCTTFSNEKGPNNVIKGKFQCAGNQQVAGNATTTPTSGNGTKKSEGLSDHLQGAHVALGFGALLATLLGLA